MEMEKVSYEYTIQFGVGILLHRLSHKPGQERNLVAFNLCGFPHFIEYNRATQDAESS
jgi:hypothetical protein